MMTKLYYMLLGALLGLLTALVMSILNLILISYIGCSYMSVNSSVIGICLTSVLILVLTPVYRDWETGIEYEKKKDYENLRDAFNLRSANPDISDCMFALPQNGQESDVLQAVSSETVQLLKQLRYRSAAFIVI